MNKSSKYQFILILGLLVLLLIPYSCGTSKKLKTINQNNISVSLSLPKESEVPELEVRQTKRDTVVWKASDGHVYHLMKTFRDEETGENMAGEVLTAAVVTARFRNVAERHGKVDLRFNITVPAAMQDKGWQLRFYPDLFMLGDSTRLEPVIVTGLNYRKAQLRGYQQYERFLSRIVTNEMDLVDIRSLEVFLRRNIPEIYAFKTDSTFVSDSLFFSYYGVTQQDAIEHYTNHLLRYFNRLRIAAKDKMYRKYVKVPIVSDGVRLDTVLQNINGDFVYEYVQTIATRPKLKKADIVISGAIFESDQKLYDMSPTEPLTFYISSLSSFTDQTERYLTEVVERRAEANVSYSIVFPVGKADIREDLADNKRQIGYVKDNLVDLMRNEVYDLDSIVIVANASPEGSLAANGRLSRKRGEAVADYFEAFMRQRQREWDAEESAFTVDENGNIVSSRAKREPIRFIARSVPENWSLLDKLMMENRYLTDLQKDKYFSHDKEKDYDRREQLMRQDDYFKFVKDTLYPKLRVVDFAFSLHRKGMIKDTVHTTTVDTTYMRGLQLLKDMEYEQAVKILGPYQDYNAAVAYMGCERNTSAMLILQNLKERTPKVNYLMAILYSRTGREQEAVQCYMDACRADASFIHRGNLDPEISVLIKLYGLNKQFEDNGDLGF